jgi:hypothetical protein
MHFGDNIKYLEYELYLIIMLRSISKHDIKIGTINGKNVALKLFNYTMIDSNDNCIKFYNEGGKSESKKITKDSMFFENLRLLSQQ